MEEGSRTTTIKHGQPALWEHFGEHACRRLCRISWRFTFVCSKISIGYEEELRINLSNSRLIPLTAQSKRCTFVFVIANIR
jgi:hypothetical protein